MFGFDGITFGGFRSVPSASPMRLRHLGKINLIAGRNNSGKSNVLRAVQRMASTQWVSDLNQPDRPVGEGEHAPTSGYALNVGSAIDRLQLPPDFTEGVQAAFKGTPVLEYGQIWFELEGWVSKKPNSISQAYYQRVLDAVTADNEREAMRVLHHVHRSSVVNGEATVTLLQALQKRLEISFPPAHMISGLRAITHTDDDAFQDLNGSNLRRRLQRLQSPGLSNLDDRRRFDSISKFVRTVLEDDSITIDVPHDLSTILVTQRDVTLPIESLGTGIHEVVIIAAAATVLTESILCIEEPEIHLHPILQRKLLRYLGDETNNQYFIATHSAHLLDSSLGSVHHVQNFAGQSKVQYIGEPEAHSGICVDLGYRASDLVQSNAVIWVEGPSDRVYVKHWIETRAPNEFVEGIHYSIMFYGGALLSSLTTNDPDEIDEFISLRRLNRFMVVLMDSDRSSVHKRINASKKRVKQALETDAHTGASWITAGYTIENYVPWEVLRAAIYAVHPKAKANIAAPGQFENPLTKERVGVAPNKTRIARHVVDSWSGEWPLDLRVRVDDVIDLLREANRTA